jgi:hypothetical protein
MRPTNFLLLLAGVVKMKKEPMAMEQRKTLEKKGLLSCLGSSMEDKVVAMVAKGDNGACFYDMVLQLLLFWSSKKKKSLCSFLCDSST